MLQRRTQGLWRRHRLRHFYRLIDRFPAVRFLFYRGGRLAIADTLLTALGDRGQPLQRGVGRPRTWRCRLTLFWLVRSLTQQLSARLQELTGGTGKCGIRCGIWRRRMLRCSIGRGHLRLSGNLLLRLLRHLLVSLLRDGRRGVRRRRSGR